MPTNASPPTHPPAHATAYSPCARTPLTLRGAAVPVTCVHYTTQEELVFTTQHNHGAVAAPLPADGTYPFPDLYYEGAVYAVSAWHQMNRWVGAMHTVAAGACMADARRVSPCAAKCQAQQRAE